MLYSYQKYLLLTESKREDELRAKYIDKLGIDENIVEDFLDYKPGSAWLLKTYANTPKEKIEEIEKKGSKYSDILLKMAKMFINNRANLSVVDIDKLKNLDNMKSVLDELTDYDLINDYDTKDVWILTNSIEWLIYKPYTYEVSNEFGNRKIRESNWCTAYDEGHFKSHQGPEGGLLYIINKLDETQDIALEITDDSITAWDYKDNSIKSSYSGIVDICKQLWDEDSEPYKVIMENSVKIEEDAPKIDYEKAKENAWEDIRYRDLYDIISEYGERYIWDNIDTDSFFDAVKDDAYDRWYNDWRSGHNLFDKTLTILREDFDGWTDKNKQTFYETFIEEMKEANEDNESEEYVTENPTMEDVITYIEDTYSKNDADDLIDKIGIEEEIVQKLADEDAKSYTDPEDYYSMMFGYKLNNMTRNEIENEYFITQHIDHRGVADDIVADMDEAELRHYV